MDLACGSSTQQVEARQESPLRLLASQERDLPPRQQTLLRAISWSYDLLEPDEQALLRRLSVFVGGCGLERLAWGLVAGGQRESAAWLFGASAARHRLMGMDLGHSGLSAERPLTDPEPVAITTTRRADASERMPPRGR